MYAVIQAGGHQYRVSKGESLVIDRMQGNPGDKIKLEKVLLVGDDGKVKVGKPYVAGATVELEIKEQTRSDKVVIFKYRRRKNYKVMRGHRQPLTVVEIKGITH
jgi:large subunit ribosomal protein L21